MLNFTCLPLLLFSICALFLPISPLAFAHELPAEDITTSEGSTHEISNLDQADAAHTKYEGKLTAARVDMSVLRYDRDLIQKGLDNDLSGLTNAIEGGAATFLAGKRPDASAAIALAREIRDFLKKGQNRAIREKLIDKYSEIANKNTDLADVFADRELFYAEYGKRWTHDSVDRGLTNNPVPKRTNKGSLSSMQIHIPPLSLSCANGCGHYFVDSRWTLVDDYWAGVFPRNNYTEVSLSSIVSSATDSHQKVCSVTPHSNYSYYSCPAHGYPGCDKSYEHYISCLGGCSTKGPPEWALVDSYGKMTNKRTQKPGPLMLLHENVTISAHKTQCPKSVSNGWGGTKTCPYWYYSCNSQSCPNASNHVSGSGSGSTASTPSENGNCDTDGNDNQGNGNGNQGNGNGGGPPLANGDCNTNGNGNGNNGNGNSNNGNGNGAPVANGGCTPTPTLVNCDKRYDYRCYVKVSNAYEHHVNCPGCYDGYWTCNSSDVAEHGLRSCTRPIQRPGGTRCDNQWRRCAHNPYTPNGGVEFFDTAPRCSTSPRYLECSGPVLP
ncbi:MAG: hypothetical protein OXI43_23280 [Candidatus Poribacteria bacterium]|nr:hypothetical protein [Candidatus Poribacteria bacterium]